MVVVIQRVRGQDLQVIEQADLEITGPDNNVLRFTPSSEVTAEERDLLWALRVVDDGRVVMKGVLAVQWAALSD